MTRYIEWGECEGGPETADGVHFDPTDLSTVQALWAALPPDLRLALAKTAPRVAGKWQRNGIRRCRPHFAWIVQLPGGVWSAEVEGTPWLGTSPTPEEAQAACDAALCAQGYVLDGDTP